MACTTDINRSLLKGNDQVLVHSGKVSEKNGFIGQVTTHTSEAVKATSIYEYRNEVYSVSQSRYKLFLGYQLVEDRKVSSTLYISVDEPLTPEQGSFNTEVRSRVPITAGAQLYGDLYNANDAIVFGIHGFFNFYNNYVFSLDNGEDFSTQTANGFDFGFQPLFRVSEKGRIALFGGPIGGLRSYPWVTTYYGWNIGIDIPIAGRHVLIGLGRQNLGIGTSGDFKDSFEELKSPFSYFLQIQL